MRLMPEASSSSSWLPSGGRRFQVTVLELGHGLLDLARWGIDGAAHAQGQGGGADQAEAISSRLANRLR
jgi:hypothetical protein